MATAGVSIELPGLASFPRQGGRRRHRLPAARLVRVADVDRRAVDKGIAAVVKAERKQPRGVADLRQMLDDPELDAVTIATPDHWHARMAIEAMERGKDVYLEKPVSHNVWEGRKIVEAARKHGKAVAMLTDSVEGVRQMIALGAKAVGIGRLHLRQAEVPDRGRPPGQHAHEVVRFERQAEQARRRVRRGRPYRGLVVGGLIGDDLPVVDRNKEERGP